jgi:hypothetical protein
MKGLSLEKKPDGHYQDPVTETLRDGYQMGCFDTLVESYDFHTLPP